MSCTAAGGTPNAGAPDNCCWCQRSMLSILSDMRSISCVILDCFFGWMIPRTLSQSCLAHSPRFFGSSCDLRVALSGFCREASRLTEALMINVMSKVYDYVLFPMIGVATLHLALVFRPSKVVLASKFTFLPRYMGSPSSI